jgi:hypothetical protein
MGRRDSNAPMTHRQTDHASVLRLCSGNAEAVDWIQLGRLYCHEIDDLIDEYVKAGDKCKAAERACYIGGLAIALYTHPFFLKNMPALKSAMLLCTLKYRDSVLMEQSNIRWQHEFSDWARHSWIEVCLVVSEICGGYCHARAQSLELWTVAFADHHDSNQHPT